MSTTVPAPQPLPLVNTSPVAPCCLLVGNPNAGKTSLFNRLTGLRAHTANFAGTTIEHRRGRVGIGQLQIELVDLPGLYSLDAVTPEEQVARAAILGEGGIQPRAVVLVLDATNLERNLFLASQLVEAVAQRQLPLVIALNMVDLARKAGAEIDHLQLGQELGCEVIPVSARTGEGLAELKQRIGQIVLQPEPHPGIDAMCHCANCNGCSFSSRYDWAERVTRQSMPHTSETLGKRTEQIDRILTHKVAGLIGFALVMLATFLLIFWIATFPMGWIEGLFAWAQGVTSEWLPEGLIQSFVSDGVIAGVGGMLVFLPQICLLFFTLALLEDSGYLARAAFVMDRLMQRVGLPGKAFVPMLSAHACAIPAIMATRVIDDRRDRLATILVLPLMTCSARVPVYTLVISLLFATQPLAAAMTFTGAYALGIVAAMTMAWLFKRTLLPGETRPLMIELPHYKLPSLRNALLLTLDRAWVFIKNAGTIILLISIGLWALATFPQADVADLSSEVQQQIAAYQEAGDEAAADNLLAQEQLEYSLAGRIGHAVEPVFAPLGFDWKMSIGIITSFAAREAVVSTLAVLYGLGADEEDVQTLSQSFAASKHPDGSPVFTTAACLSLLVFYVLAMQCLPTQVVTRRETGSWKWPALQFGYMTVLAYTAALLTYQTAAALGWA